MLEILKKEKDNIKLIILSNVMREILSVEDINDNVIGYWIKELIPDKENKKFIETGYKIKVYSKISDINEIITKDHIKMLQIC